ncbi:hypothetical protein [Leeia sp.]|uniref:hypothetical protein n=1 Tax=Leeia sp. TaxID=2884678 RepID=UPI0035B410D0
MQYWHRGHSLWLICTLGMMGCISITLWDAQALEPALRSCVRQTARTSLALFLLTFCCSALHTLWPSALTQTLLRYRRQLGLSFATSHLIHAGLFIQLGMLNPALGKEVFAAPMLILGGSGYLMIALMAATSNEAAIRMLGGALWKRLHTFGVYWLWLLFVLTVGKRLAQGPLYSAMLAALLIGLVLRLWEQRQLRARIAAAAS